jgi:hypothetical protein
MGTNQLYHRDLRRRVEALEAQIFPEPEDQVWVYWQDEDGLPQWVTGPGIYWTRRENEPIPPEYLRFATAEARAAIQAPALQDVGLRAPPRKPKPQG